MEQTRKTTFHTWDKLRKATLYAGICVILLIFIATLWKWGIISNKMQESIAKLSEQEKEVLIKTDNMPKILPNFWSVTGTFTWISNLTVGITLVLFAIYPKHWLHQRALFLANTYITITFIVFWTLIFPASFKHFEADVFFDSLIVHFINPLICFVFVILNRKKIQVTKLTIWLASVVMVAYWAFALIVFFIGEPIANQFATVAGVKNIYDAGKLVVYKFLNFRQPLFYKGSSTGIVVLLNFVIFVVGFFLTPGLGFAWKYALKIKYDTTTQPWKVY
ncbi:MAGa3780 family membrane protein [Mycoplasma seminis]|uniref:DUF1361 domain-containing protein n=1 Tax=Mycoplasma seminis TaxID=512749 RepID=A0ABY9HB04_9MOLU|nr:hypothetical protein [Mycoplasma seminis]WLP85379.1 hypothetical protein Q8852_03600 [Mycoplasma seminis]